MRLWRGPVHCCCLLVGHGTWSLLLGHTHGQPVAITGSSAKPWKGVLWDRTQDRHWLFSMRESSEKWHQNSKSFRLSVGNGKAADLEKYNKMSKLKCHFKYPKLYRGTQKKYAKYEYLVVTTFYGKYIQIGKLIEFNTVIHFLKIFFLH